MFASEISDAGFQIPQCSAWRSADSNAFAHFCGADNAFVGRGSIRMNA